MFEEAARREAENKARAAVDKLYAENGNALQKLADIEREERMTENERIKVIQTACGAIDKYSDALKALAETEKVELREELEKKKKENFELVATACMKEYEQKYGELPSEDKLMYLESTFYGTGNGHTTSLLITYALPSIEDYDRDAEYPQNYQPINSQEYRAVREFHELFGTFSLYGLRFHSKEEFFTRYKQYLPDIVVRLKDENCYQHFYTEFHFNYS